jgi:hypothetical protein
MGQIDGDPSIDAPRYLYVKLPRCPRCNGIRFVGNHTTRRTNGVSVRHSRCKICGQRVNIVKQ